MCDAVYWWSVRRRPFGRRVTPASFRARRTVLAATPSCLATQSADCPPRVELGGPVDIVVLERPAIPLRDATAPDVAEHRRPVHLERGCQLLHGDTLAVGGDQFGLLVGCKASLNREGSDDRVGGANRRLAGALSQHRPQRQHQECRAIYLRKRAASGR